MLPSNFDKFRLLLWKNWILQWNNKRELLAELLLPVAFILLLVFLRTSIIPKHTPKVIYNEMFPLDTLSGLQEIMANPFYTKSFKYHLGYSPNTSLVFEKIVEAAATSLKLTYSGYANSDDLEKILIKEKYLAGVDFNDTLAHMQNYPERLDYQIRFPSELRTALHGSLDTWTTNKFFPDFSPPGPRNRLAADGGTPVGYLREGFLAVQDAVAMAFIKQTAKDLDQPLPQIFLQRYPYTEYKEDPFLGGMAGIMSVIILLSYLYPCSCQVKYITAEKEKQLKEVMKIIGLQNSLHWIAWFVKGFAMLGFSSFAIAIVLKVKWRNNLAVLTYSSFSAVLFLLLVFSVASIALCFMLATFFSRASNAAAITGLVWFILYLPSAYFHKNTSSFAARICWCIFSNTAMGLAVRIIIIREGSTEGVQWDNLFKESTLSDELSLAHLMGMMCLSCGVYMIICLYVEQIYPGDYGVPQPWNFPCKKSFWFGEQKIDTDDTAWNQQRKIMGEFFEYEPSGKTVGLKIRNLCKIYGNKFAVKDLSLNMYEGEITVLLGHNGAGKTTTIFMLIGMFSPTSGTAIINGYDIRTHLKEARESLGICPQHNILFDDMTVRDHLIFYSSLKGLKGKELEDEVNKFLKVIDLEDKADEVSSKLSGGMKRKLSVCSAFCGDTKVVLCDEPSSGMDPAARRAMWDMLQSEKKGRTILLTTHFMDEADILGDRIAIMAGGELKCDGTSFFLKKKFGSGYQLICVKMADCDSQKVTELLRKYIPNISPESDVGTELRYQCPEEYARVFQKMFEELEAKSSGLGLNGFGISVSPLEEVFMKMGAEKPKEQDAATLEKVTSASSGIGSKDVEELFAINKREVKGVRLCLNQWRAMILKKYLQTIRNRIGIAILIMTPIIFTVLTIIVATGSGSGDANASPLPPMMFSLLRYRASVTVLETTSNVIEGSLPHRISKSFEGIFKSYPPDHWLQQTGPLNFTEHILRVGEMSQPYVDAAYIVGATIDDKLIVAWFNNEALHSAPTTLNLIHNAIARAVIKADASIVVRIAPLPYTEAHIVNVKTSNERLGIELSSNMSFCMCFISALYSVFLIKERETRAKLLQFVGGINVVTFWVSHYIWDLFTFTLSALISITTLAYFQKEGYSTYEELGRNFVVLFSFACTALPFTYIASTLFTAPAVGFAILSITNIFFGNALFVTTFLLSYIMPDTVALSETMRKYLLAFPHYAMAVALHGLFLNSKLRSACESMASRIPAEDRCEHLPQCCHMEPYFGWKSPGVLREEVYLITTGVISALLLILKEYRVVSKVKHFIDKWRQKWSMSGKRPKVNFDEDVEIEKEQIRNMTKSEIGAQNLVVDRLTKVYGTHVAVNEISIYVKSSECFGLLGTNGAGKTTTFKMLTGDEPITSGEAYVKGLRIKMNMKSVYNEIGYCPQFDALLDELTGRETLRIFCLLRGIANNKISEVSKGLARSFGFRHHSNKLVANYSGGSKRKLSAALAFIGCPSVVYLDEPTSSMDPASRRHMWNVVCMIRDAGESIVLTSHSMDECEALCTRLAIMVNGSFKCIGSTQHLKNKFAKGFILKFKLTRLSMDRDFKVANVKKVLDFITQEFSEAHLQEELEGIFTFYIPVAKISWANIFNAIETNKTKLNIEDYSISQTTLEEIFLEFAKTQREDPLVEA